MRSRCANVALNAEHAERTCACNQIAQAIHSLPLSGGDALARVRLEARIEEAHWWEHLVGFTEPDHPERHSEECLYCERIAELESQLAALAERGDKGGVDGC